jgi:hypothetical protein
MDAGNDPTITRDVIYKKLIEFNESGTDVKLVIADYYTQKGGLDLKLDINGKLTDYVKMEPVKN